MKGHPFEWKGPQFKPFWSSASFSSSSQASYFCKDSELGKASLMAASVRLEAMVLSL